MVSWYCIPAPQYLSSWQLFPHILTLPDGELVLYPCTTVPKQLAAIPAINSLCQMLSWYSTPAPQKLSSCQLFPHICTYFANSYLPPCTPAPHLCSWQLFPRIIIIIIIIIYCTHFARW